MDEPIFDDLYNLAVPDLEIKPSAPGSPLDLGFGSFDSIVSELDALGSGKAAHNHRLPIQPPPARPRNFGRAPRPKTTAADRDAMSPGSALERWFPKEVLQLKPREYQKIKKERFHLLSDAEAQELTALRRRIRNCVYAEDKRQRRIRDKRDADVANATLLEENQALREENARLRLELAAFSIPRSGDDEL